tara:strand:+ start:4433 stop:4756 length:324 start_codon:yes stop_codon:yes gene_type:complete
MAVDDVVSDFDTGVATTAIGSIQPASGDEWLVTHIFAAIDNWDLLSHVDAKSYMVGLFGGDTAAAVKITEVGLNPVRLFMTNSEYLRVRNNDGGTRSFAFSAIKIKE